MSSFEVVVDNAKLLSNCFEEAPVEEEHLPLTFDLGFRNTQLDYSPFTSNFMGMADPDESSEFIIPSNGHSAYSDGYWAMEDHGDEGWPNTIFLPDVPDGYSLTHATYVLKAYRASANSAPTSPWPDAYGPPTAFPFVYIDSAATDDFHSFDPLPIGGYSGEILSNPNSEFLSRIIETGSVAHMRMWYGRGLSSEAMAPIHVAYFALRLTYEYLEGSAAWHVVDLSSVVMAYDTGGTPPATFTDGKLVCSPTLWCDFVVTGLTLDRTKVYEIEMTSEIEGTPAAVNTISVYTTSAYTDSASLWNDTFWQYIHSNDYIEHEIPVETITFGYGIEPGASNWEDGFDEEPGFPATNILFEPRKGQVITQLRWRIVE